MVEKLDGFEIKRDVCINYMYELICVFVFIVKATIKSKL